MSDKGGIVAKFKNDFTPFDGLWYELKKDKFTFFEVTGKCNRAKVKAQLYEVNEKTKKPDFNKPLDAATRYLTSDGKEVQAKKGFHTIQHMSMM
mmetsp:Transcript_12328/g.15715  ORF Transcript_12328/g.15715 Transcript_12328/m.15715 type:complete len:94 (+) Transcript_12328:86-367(+)